MKTHLDLTYQSANESDTCDGYGEAACGADKRAVNDLRFTGKFNEVDCKRCLKVIEEIRIQGVKNELEAHDYF